MIDLSSDTATRPTPAMRAAIAAAEVGDEQRGEDPTCNRLQDRVAELLGMEAAMFLVSGTMCNHVAVATHTRPGDAVVVDARSHILRSETGGLAALAGVVFEPVPGERGHFSAEQLAAVLRPGSLYEPPTRLVALEQTHNFAGGTVWPLDRWQEVTDLASSAGVPVHVDGARLLNAVVATGVPAATWAGGATTTWIDFTKGLGAPIGAVLAGPAELIARARRTKHLFGAALRQAGIAAAGCLYALDHHVERLADDHDNARYLAEGLEKLGYAVEPPDTNMVFFDPGPLGSTPAALCEALLPSGVRMGEASGRVRAVTHLDVSRADLDTALAAVQQLA